jgi:hypothetical protein
MAADARAAAEVAFRAVIDAQRADLALLRARWPDRESLESRAALDRLAAASAPDGDADRAIAAVHAAYGGHDRVPEDVRARMEQYVWERLGERPWPARDLAEAPTDPVLGRPRPRAAAPQEASGRGR